MFPSFEATKRYELLEIQVPASTTNNKFTIPDQPQLRSDQDADIIIQGIDAFDINAITLSPNNVAIVSLADFQKTYLVLYIEGEESIYRIPLVSMNRVANAGSPSPFVYDLFKLRNVQVDWTKSYFMTPAAWAQTTFSFLLGVHYYKLPPGTMSGIDAREMQLFANP